MFSRSYAQDRALRAEEKEWKGSLCVPELISGGTYLVRKRMSWRVALRIIGRKFNVVYFVNASTGEISKRIKKNKN